MDERFVATPHACRLVDPAMAKMLAAIERYLCDGGTMQSLGELAGYDPRSARKSVSQFIKTSDPRISVVRRFANAMKMDVREVL